MQKKPNQSTHSMRCTHNWVQKGSEKIEMIVLTSQKQNKTVHIN